MAVDSDAALSDLRVKASQIVAVKKPELMRTKIAELEEQVNSPTLWDDADAAQKITRELSNLKASLGKIEHLEQGINDVEAYFEMHSELLMQGEKEEAATIAAEASLELEALQNEADELEIQTMLSGKFDEREAVVTIRSGAGGVEAQDWAQMLLRMYTRWCEAKEYNFQVEDISYGEEAGIKSATFEVHEPYAFGELAAEAGTHRLVRLSPFNSLGKRQTSFAAVEVIPLIEETDHIEIPADEIKTDVFRASGPGGQCVNTTDSAVRMTHIPTGITVSMQNEKDQHQNKAAAMRVLQSRLLLLKQAQEAAEKHELAGDIKASWGDQIRNYVLHPYRMVKDTRTAVETSQTDKVLDGDIDQFIRAGVRYRARPHPSS
jgi:peptide chain release factor 2